MYVQSNTLLLADVFENFRNMCLKTYELDPAKFLSSAESASMASNFRKDWSKIRIIADIVILLTAEKKVEYVMQFIIMQKLITNTWKIMIKIKNRHILNIGM